MTVSTLDPHPALVLIDLQKGIVGAPGGDAVVDRAAELCAAFRAKNWPVVLVNVTGGAPGRTEANLQAGDRAADWAVLDPRLGPQADDHLVTKRRWGAFYGTDLDAHLREHGVTQIVLGGISTSAGVESTARAAHEHGYHVVLATDAMTDRSPEAHRHSIEHVFPRLGERGTTAEIVALIEAANEQAPR